MQVILARGAGNTAEAKTLLPMIRGLLARYPLKRVVLIADRGLLCVFR